MRPLQLSLQGLHSFREKQTIDFSSLCDGGVFGIFGPTGSGKSTLLDAMTLALYGSVERAMNNTQGVMNQLEEQMSVSFTFELGDRHHAARYKVERTFKRSGDHTIKTAICRLIEETVEPRVLADKKNDVDQAVISLLGLSIDDFTRAVVLPQGKFSEFLQLRGTERRQMLQRLFHLEQFGDRLLRNIKVKLQEARHENERILAEQSGLGDTSLTGLKQAEKEYDYWSGKLKKALKEKQNMDSEWEMMKQLWIWQQDMKEAEKQLADCEVQSSNIENYKKLLEESERAKGLKPFADTLLQSRKDLDYWRRMKESSLKEYNQSVNLLELKAKEWENFSKEKESALKKLDDRQKSVDQAKKLDTEIKKLFTEKNQAHEHLQILAKNAEELNNELDREEFHLKKYKKAVRDMEEQYNLLYVPPQEKHLLLQAREEKQQLSYMEERIKDQKDLKTQKENSKKNIHQKLTEVKNNQFELAKKLQARFNQTNHWFSVVSEHSRWMELQSISVRDQIDDLDKKEQKRKMEHMALELSLLLKDGDPCPVCGSVNHPYPAEHFNQAAATEEITKEEKELAQSWIKKLQEEQFALKEKKWELEQASLELTKCLGEQLDASSVIQAVQEEYNFLNTHTNIEQQTEVFKRKFNKWKKEEETIHNLLSNIRREVESYSQLTEEFKQIHYHYEEINHQMSQTTEQIIKIETDFKQALTKWQQKYSSFDYDKLDEEYRKLKEREEQCDYYKKRAENGNRHVQELQEQCESKRAKVQSIELEKTDVDSKYRQLQSFLSEREIELSDILGKQSIEEITSHIKQQQEEWAMRENRLKGDLEDIKRKAVHWEKEKDIAEHSCEDMTVRYETAQKEWENQINRGQFKFSSPEEISNKILQDDEIKDYQSEIEQYEKEKQKWLNLLENVKAKLKGRIISEEEWSALNQSRDALYTKIDEIREKMGSTSEQLREIKWKRERFEQLEKVRKAWEEKTGQYQKLYTVFRGKSFIEFLAEEQLIQISRMASERLHALTRGKYALEVDSNGGFIIRDDANGGVRRPISSLSGGETFLTSLALALSLSASIQLKGQYPLEFFFLDEGFGTLDQELLDTVISSLEKLQTDSLSVGIISHVPELQERIARKIEVIPAQPDGTGSKIALTN